MNSVKKSKVVVIGAGSVGESVAYALAIRGHASEIVIVDIAEDRAIGNALDINHGIAFRKSEKIYKGDYSDCKDAGVIIVTAGLPRKAGQTRLDLAKANINIAKSIAKSIKKYAEDPIIVVISNPVDIMTYVIQKETGFPAERVIGTGTMLDTSRFRFSLAEKLGVDITEIDANVLGEHGDSQVPIWSSATVAGIPLLSFAKQKGVDLLPFKEEINETVKKSGSTIISLKGVTNNGIALNASHIVDVIIGNTHSVIPVCHVNNTEVFGNTDIPFSLPCVIGENGIEQVLEVSISEEEKKALENSSKILKDFISEIFSDEDYKLSDPPTKREIALAAHAKWQGKFEITGRAPINTPEELAIAYTPGVAEPCLEIQKDVDLSYTYTRRGNLVAVVTDGTAVLGLGDIGPEAGMPVMEGKAALFKRFGNVDAFPLCIRSKDVDEIVKTVELLAGSFGGINLEDISAPRCFEIEERLKKSLDIPVFHDDQHGTAVVVLAGLLNALKIVGKDIKDIKVVTSGAGAAGIAIIKLLYSVGLKNVIMCDRTGAIYEGRENLNPVKEEMAKISNLEKKQGKLGDVIEGADVFIGVSGPGTLTKEMVQKMAKDPIIFALANPVPEIMPDEAAEAGAAVIATGRSDFPNQINNVLVFPGLFRGALDVRAREINDDMKIAAAHAIADSIKPEDLNKDNIIPKAFEPGIADKVAAAVADAAVRTGVNRINR
ncbi:MAG: L-lactate dehydrogenase [Clostridia bacterium]|nr:L-lactate dehydrogenase [Clostridia bacterium]